MIAAALLGALYGGASAAPWKISDAAAPMDGGGLDAAAAVYAVLGVGWFSVGFPRPTKPFVPSDESLRCVSGVAEQRARADRHELRRTPRALYAGGATPALARTIRAPQ